MLVGEVARGPDHDGLREELLTGSPGKPGEP